MASIVFQLKRAFPASAPRKWRGHVAELSIYVGFYLLYLLLRGLVIGGETHALSNASRVIALEQALRLFHEPLLQEWALANAQPLVVFLNWVYIVTYWPVILGGALILYLTRRATYYRYRNLIVVHLVLALALFVLFPLAPPYKTAHLVDTIQSLGPAFYGGEAMANLYNTNAAMPSLHFSWTCIFAWLFVREIKGWSRYLGLIYPLLTLAAIVITGNHYFLDAVVGAALIGVACGLVEARRRRSGTWQLWRARVPFRDRLLALPLLLGFRSRDTER